MQGVMNTQPDTHTIGRLVDNPADADWIAHDVLDGFIELEPVSDRARADAADKGPDCHDLTTGWMMAEWWEMALESAVAREVANGWNVAPERPLDSERFARVLAAITVDPPADPDDVPEWEWRGMFVLATTRGADR